MRWRGAFLLFFLNTTVARATYYAENVIGGCDPNSLYSYNGAATVVAIYAPNEYTCAEGYYLPANTDGCVVCPTGHTCSGGTYTFNKTKNQGMVYSFPIVQNVRDGCAYPLAVSGTRFSATYAPNEHTCTPGYYMPANTDGCVICPANSYCSGGTYTFNETVAQGVQSCAAGLYSPTGMWESTQCGHILHIGNDIVYLHSVKKTTPSLNAKIGNDVFYGNMTTADVVMNSGTTHKLQVRYNDTVYSVYDDTVTVPIE